MLQQVCNSESNGWGNINTSRIRLDTIWGYLDKSIEQTEKNKVHQLEVKWVSQQNDKQNSTNLQSQQNYQQEEAHLDKRWESMCTKTTDISNR